MIEPNFDYYRDQQLREWLNRPDDNFCVVCHRRIEDDREYCSPECEDTGL